MDDRPLSLLAPGKPTIITHFSSLPYSGVNSRGICGLSELIVLEEIINQIKHDLNSDEDLLPADFSDLIGGTSTGR
jgi:hypothetical protein